ncbi:uncharacterized protein [Dermacentor andersoni]|uniref:uncharacterized protein isoform X3 n=1 Tax=Dermacentor andersoni TaxID=34620 RepID=UPI0024164BEB|nr:uncharacterized protein LOC126540575 isoform X4 [Dermacentor andersoni]
MAKTAVRTPEEEAARQERRREAARQRMRRQRSDPEARAREVEARRRKRGEDSETRERGRLNSARYYAEHREEVLSDSKRKRLDDPGLRVLRNFRQMQRLGTDGAGGLFKPSQAGAFRYQSADESKAKKHHARAVQAKPRVRPIGFLFAVRHRYTNRPFVVQIRKSEEMSPGLCDGSLRLMILNDGFTSRSTADDLELPNSCQTGRQVRQHRLKHFQNTYHLNAGGSLCPPSRSTLCNSHCAKETKMRMSLHQVKGSFRGASYFTCWPAVGQPGMAKKRKLRQPCNKASVLHKSLELFFVYPNVWIITRLGQIHSRKLLLAKATPHFLSHVSRHIDFSILADNFLWQRRE